jgi:hypothetical protein
MAGRASLAFLGQDDIALSGDPEVTYFLEKYATSTPFASKFHKVQFTDAVLFGEEASVELPRVGDLVTSIFFKLTFPKGAAASVLDSAGTLMFRRAELICDGHIVESLPGEYMEFRNDVSVPQGRQAALGALVGKGTTVPRDSYTIPLEFSCLRSGLPMCAIKDSVISVRLVLQDALDFTTPQVIIYRPLDAYLHVEYAYLADPERTFMASKPFTYLYQQVQLVEIAVPAGKNTLRMFPGLRHPVKEMIVVVQNETSRGYDFTLDGTRDQLDNLTMFFSGVDRIPALVGSALFLRVIQAMEYHTRLPDRMWYMYSFCLDPEDPKPTGAVNMSRIQNQVLDLNLNAPAVPVTRLVRVYAVNHNFFEVANGRGKVLFPN